MPKGRVLATAAGVGGIVLWATETVLITETGSLPPFQIVALAFAVAALPSPLIWLATGTGPLAALRQPARVWLLTVSSLLGYHSCLYHAVQNAPAAPAALLQGCTPLMIVVGSALLPGERLRWWHVVGALAGFAGFTTLVMDEYGMGLAGADPAFYLAVIGAAAALWGIYSLATRTFVDVPTSAMGAFYLGTAVVAGLGHVLLETWVWPAPSEWAAIVGLGLLPIGLALYLWDYGVKAGDIQALGAFSYVEPLLGAGLVAVLAGNDLGWTIFVAAILIVGGAALAAKSAWA